MTFPSQPQTTTQGEQPRQIKPVTRHKFAPARLPEVNTDPIAPVPADDPAQVSQPARGPFGGRLSLPARPPKVQTPHLHPALRDVEQQETRSIPQLSQPVGEADTSATPAWSDGTSDQAREAGLMIQGTASAHRATAMKVLYQQTNFSVLAVSLPGQKADPLRKPSGHTTRMPQVMPQQRERVAVSLTRRIPKVDVRETLQTSLLPIPLWLEVAALLLLLVGVICLHAYHLFQFPAYTMDEGTYMQNAWAITVGRLSPYPYGYGHPPVGWMQLALWVKLSGLFRFGSAIDSGRVLMVAYAAGGALLIYLIARRLGGSKSAALLALALYAFSPLSVTLQREVLLDNIATFWLLLSLYLIVVSRSRLLYLTGAALALGLAILSKEVLAIVLPAMIYAAWLHITPFQRKFALVTFIYITLAMLSTFVLMALLKGELFPYAWHLPWDHHPHLSLLDTYVGQLQRGQNQGSLLESWQVWWQEDAPLMSVGVVAGAFNLLYGWRERKHLLVGLLALSYWLLLVRGGVVYIFYLIPLIPLIALNVALTLHVILSWFSKLIHVTSARALLLLLLFSLLLPYNVIGAARQANANPVLAQQQALTWMRGHLPRTAYIVIDAYMYLDLRQPGDDGPGNSTSFSRAEVYWNVATDPAIRDGVLHNNWNNIDYLVVDNQMLTDMQNNSPEFSILQQALAHANLLASFHTSDQLEDVTLQIYQVRHQNTPLVQSGKNILNWRPMNGTGGLRDNSMDESEVF